MKLAEKAISINPHAAKLVLLGLSSLLLASCGLFGKKDDKQPEYYSAVETPPLTIPEGLDNPTVPSALVIGIPPAPLAQRELSTVPPRVSSQSAGGTKNARVGWSAEGVYLLVEDTPDSVQRRLGFALKRSGMSVVDTPAGEGYQFNFWHHAKREGEGFFSRLAFWRDDPPNYSGSYRTMTQADGENTRVFIKNADGSDADPDAAEHILVLLSERFG